MLRALEAAPKGFEIRAREEKNHVFLQPGKTTQFINACGTSIFHTDSQEAKLPTRKEFYDYMIRTADVLLSDSDHRTSGSRTWYDSWWRTIPTRVVSYPGLYVGAAGCGSSY